MRSHLVLLSLSFLSACSGGGSEPLRKDNTTTPSITQTAQCGDSFSAQRHLNKQEINTAYWQIEGEQLQTKPQVNFFTTRSSSLAETSYRGSETLCEQVANIFGANIRETWQGAETSSIKPGQQLKYTPELSLSFSLPNFASLADWRAQGSPRSVTTQLAKSTLTVWYENNEDQRFLQGELVNNQKELPLNCENNAFQLTVLLSEIDSQFSANLNPAYCEESRNGNITKTSCLNISLAETVAIEQCQFALTDVYIPDSQGNKTAVKLAGKVSAETDSGVILIVDGIDIN